MIYFYVLSAFSFETIVPSLFSHQDKMMKFVVLWNIGDLQ